MAVQVRVRIVKNNSGAILERIKKRVEQATEAAGVEFETGAKAIVPVKTGRLQRSIQVLALSSTMRRFEATESYGPYVEFGTSRAAAQPFFLPTFDRVADRYLKAIRRIAQNP
jgi:HK97 gp10 family phage protein